jgi:hypothetical protein
MTRVEYLSVKNFERFQHYRDRSPVWIKLYNSVMDDDAFVALSDAERGQLVLIWLLASRRANKIPNDSRAVARAIQASGRVNLERFIASGFLVPYQSASDVLAEPTETPEHANGKRASKTLANALAEPEQNATPHARPRARGEGEREKEAEGEKTNPSPRAAGRGGKAGSPTWLTPFADAWRERFGGPMPIEPALRPLSERRAEHGDEETLRRWRNYLAVATPEYVSAARFASTWDRWDTAQARQSTRSSAPNAAAVEAGNLVAQIRELIFEQPIPGQASRRLLRNADVERLGDDVHRAYRTVGGASRFLAIDGKPEDLPHLIRAFTDALHVARAELAAESKHHAIQEAQSA